MGWYEIVQCGVLAVLVWLSWRAVSLVQVGNSPDEDLLDELEKLRARVDRLESSRRFSSSDFAGKWN